MSQNESDATVTTAACIMGRDLLSHSRNLANLRAFLDPHPLRLGPEPTPLHKSIIVLRNVAGANFHIIGDGKRTLPMLRRTGKYPPSMQVTVLGNRITTDADEQRIGCDYINTQKAAEHFIKHTTRFLITLAEGSPADFGVADLEELVRKRLLQLYRKIEIEEIRDLLKDELFDERASMVIQTHVCPLLNKSGQGVADASQVPERLPENEWFTLLARLFLFKTPAAQIDQVKFQKMLREQWNDTLREEAGKHLSRSLADQDFIEATNRAFIMLKTAAQSGIHLLRHKDIFVKQKDKGISHIVVQGCGDLSMNSWNVAYYENHIIHEPEEPLDRREYRCLIHWKSNLPDELKNKLRQFVEDKELYCAGSDTPDASPTLSIGRVRFSRYDTGPNSVRLVAGNSTLPIKEHIHFALYGQRLAWTRKVVAPREIIPECSDLRHILRLVDLNPRWEASETHEKIEATLKKILAMASERLLPLFARDDLKEAYAEKPRYLFGLPSYDSVWLGEYALLSNSDQSRTACEHPVDIKLSDLGAPLDWITVCLDANGYTLQESRDTVSQAGDFTWDLLDPTDPKLVWYPQISTYPCNLIGIGRLHEAKPQREKTQEKDKPVSLGGDLFLLAWGHKFGEDQSYTIFECATILTELGAQAVLLIDEGNDVFQHYFRQPQDVNDFLAGAHNEKWSPVPPAREQIRATLAFWTQA